MQLYPCDALYNMRFGGEILFVKFPISYKPLPLVDDGNDNFVHVDVISTN